MSRDLRTIIIDSIKSNVKAANVFNSDGKATLRVKTIGEGKDSRGVMQKIINLQGCTAYQRDLIFEAIEEAGGLDSMAEEDLQKLSNMTLSYSFPIEWLSSDRPQFVPEVGDNVVAELGFHWSEKFNTDVLGVNKIRPIENAVKASASKFANPFATDKTDSEPVKQSEGKKIAKELEDEIVS